MRKLHLLHCFDVTDAVKDGIDDFNRLSGCKCPVSKAPTKPAVKKVYKPFKILTVSILAIIIKFFR
jgi:hypothetical protein